MARRKCYEPVSLASGVMAETTVAASLWTRCNPAARAGEGSEIPRIKRRQAAPMFFIP
jgi:hypothetical protein